MEDTNGRRGVEQVGGIKYFLPVERDDQVVESEASGVSVVHVPDAPQVMVPSMARIVKGVIHRDDNGQQPSDDSQDLVGDDGAPAVRVSLGEGVD